MALCPTTLISESVISLNGNAVPLLFLETDRCSLGDIFAYVNKIILNLDDKPRSKLEKLKYGD